MIKKRVIESALEKSSLDTLEKRKGSKREEDWVRHRGKSVSAMDRGGAGGGPFIDKPCPDGYNQQEIKPGQVGFRKCISKGIFRAATWGYLGYKSFSCR